MERVDDCAAVARNGTVELGVRDVEDASRVEDCARAFGSDAVLEGRAVDLDGTDVVNRRAALSHAVLEVRVLEVDATRVVDRTAFDGRRIAREDDVRRGNGRVRPVIDRAALICGVLNEDRVVQSEVRRVVNRAALFRRRAGNRQTVDSHVAVRRHEGAVAVGVDRDIGVVARDRRGSIDRQLAVRKGDRRTVNRLGEGDRIAVDDGEDD